MTYFQQVYTNSYDIFVGATSWMLYAVAFIAIGIIVGVFQENKLKHKGTVSYYGLTFLLGWFLIKLVLWVFLPTPELIFDK